MPIKKSPRHSGCERGGECNFESEGQSHDGDNIYVLERCTKCKKRRRRRIVPSTSLLVTTIESRDDFGRHVVGGDVVDCGCRGVRYSGFGQP